MCRVNWFKNWIGLLLAVAMLSGCGQEAQDVSASETEAVQTESAAETEAPAQVGSPTHDKEETVTAKLDADGSITEITVETLLRNPGDGQPIEDKTNLTDLRNMEGDEEFTLGDDGTLLWENEGSNIRYKGNSTQPLPISVKITYTLDGQPIQGQALAGKSGHLVMRFDYENLTSSTQTIEGKQYDVCAPLIALTMVPLDEEVFRNITVTNGKLMSMDDTSVAIGYALPGFAQSLKLSSCKFTEDVDIPEYFEIEADVVDFELAFTATMVSTELLKDTDLDSIGSDDYTVDGTVDDIDDSVDDMLSGTNSLSEGIAHVEDAVKKLTDGLKTLDDGVGKIRDGAVLLRDNGEALNQGSQQIANLLGGMDTYLEAEITAQLINSGTPAENITEDMILSGKLQIFVQMQLVNAEQEQNLEAALAGWDSLTDEQKEEIRSSLKLKTYGDTYAAGVAQYTSGVSQLSQGIAALKDATFETRNVGDEFTKAFTEIQNGIGDFQEGIRDFRDEGVQELKDLASDTEALEEVSNRLEAMQQAGNEYISYGGILPGKSGCVSFILETEKIEK